jgi:hypothetical protein
MERTRPPQMADGKAGSGRPGIGNGARRLTRGPRCGRQLLGRFSTLATDEPLRTLQIEVGEQVHRVLLGRPSRSRQGVSVSTHRLDVELVARRLALGLGPGAVTSSRHGAVLLGRVPRDEISTRVTADQSLELVPGWRAGEPRGIQLVHALEAFGHDGLRVDGKRCFDVGACTGGI